MKGARNISDRVWLMTHLAGIICVSEHIKQCFLDGLSAAAFDEAKICAVLNGTTRHLCAPQPKQNRILIIGRMVPEKGILPACRAVASILDEHPDWCLDVVGGRHFKTETPSAYEEQIAQTLGLFKPKSICMDSSQPLLHKACKTKQRFPLFRPYGMSHAA